MRRAAGEAGLRSSLAGGVLGAVIAGMFLLASCGSAGGTSPTPLEGGTGGTGSDPCEGSRACECPEGSGTQAIDVCTGQPKEDCRCPEPRECTDPIGCRGRQLCLADSCGTCKCLRRLGQHAGEARALSVASDGTAFVLLEESPWIVRVRATDAATALNVRSDLGWASGLFADSDGSLIVFGTSGELTLVGQVQRLDAEGQLIGSARWTMASGASTFVRAAGRAPDGSVTLVATGATRVALATLTPTNEIVERGGAPITAVTSTPEVHDVDFLPNGNVLLTGLDYGSRVDGLWFAVVNSAGLVQRNIIDTEFDLFNPFPQAAVGPGGQIYVRWSWHYNERQPMVGYLRRMTTDLVELWTRLFSDDVQDTTLTAHAAIGDGSIVFGPRGFVARLDVNGGVIGTTTESESTGATIAVARNDLEVLLLANSSGSFTLSELRFEQRGSPNGAPGSVCSSDGECTSGRCCLTGTSAGTCSATPTCTNGSLCSGNSQCESGLCLTAVSAGSSGVCALPCSASAECPNASYCVPCGIAGCTNACMVDCLSGGRELCQSVHGTFACAPRNNTEGIEVSVCH